jgi:UDP-glucose 4-epimerase
MKFLVIGGSGFLGSHIADELTNCGYEVTILDVQYSKWLNSKQKMIIGDLLDLDFLNQIVSGFDYVYHFAALSDLNVAKSRPIESAKINILGTINVLEACKNNNIKRLFYASSIYVNSRDGSFYRCSKIAAESYIEEYFNQYALNYTILRYGSLYGPRSDNHNGLWRIISRALQTKIISFEGSSESLREYIHVIDAAIASVSVLDNEFVNKQLVLTGQEPMKLKDLLHMIAEILGEEYVVKFGEEYNGHYIRTPYSFKKDFAKKYIPPMHIDLGQGILELIKEIEKKV